MRARYFIHRVVLIFSLALLPAVLVPATPAHGAGARYVAPGGNNRNDCLSPAAPCATINGAIRKAASGDTIYVAVGTYTDVGDQVVLVDKGAALSGGWNDAFTVQAGMSVVDGQDARRGITVNSGVYVTVERFVIQNGKAGNGGGIANSGVVVLNDTIIKNSG
jgi:hypothetical protein